MNALLIIGSGAVGSVVGALGGMVYADANRKGDFDFSAVMTVPVGAFIGGVVGVTAAAIRWA